MVLGTAGREVVGADGGLVVRLIPVAVVASGFDVISDLGGLADAEPESIPALLEQALTHDARPTLPASRSSSRRLTTSERSPGRSGPGTFMASRYGRNFRSRGVLIIFQYWRLRAPGIGLDVMIGRSESTPRLRSRSDSTELAARTAPQVLHGGFGKTRAWPLANGAVCWVYHRALTGTGGMGEIYLV